MKPEDPDGPTFLQRLDEAQNIRLDQFHDRMPGPSRKTAETLERLAAAGVLRKLRGQRGEPVYSLSRLRDLTNLKELVSGRAAAPVEPPLRYSIGISLPLTIGALVLLIGLAGNFAFPLIVIGGAVALSQFRRGGLSPPGRRPVATHPDIPPGKPPTTPADARDEIVRLWQSSPSLRTDLTTDPSVILDQLLEAMKDLGTRRTDIKWVLENRGEGSTGAPQQTFQEHLVLIDQFLQAGKAALIETRDEFLARQAAGAVSPTTRRVTDATQLIHQYLQRLERELFGSSDS